VERGGPAKADRLPRDPETRAEVLRLLAEIRDLRADLAKTGKDALTGIDRKRTEAEIQATLKELRETRGERAAEARDKARERRQTIREGLNAFDLIPDETTPGSEVRGQFRDLGKMIRSVGGKVPETFEKLSDKGAKLADKIEAWGEKVETSRQKLADLIQERESFESSVRGTFNNDIFGNGVAGLMLQLEADTNDANARNAALQQLLGMGINGQGGLFKELAASGDLGTAQQLVAQVEAMFNARASAQGFGASLAGEAAYGALVSRQEAVVERQEVMINTLTIRLEEVQRKAARDAEQAVERGAQKGAEKGTRDGMKDRDKQTNQRARANR
jgi:hypothetical protein